MKSDFNGKLDEQKNEIKEIKSSFCEKLDVQRIKCEQQNIQNDIIF